MIVENNFIPNICSKISGMNIAAVTIFFWVFIRPENMDEEQLMTHESIHVEQYKETLLLGFFLFYGYDFLIGIVKGINWEEAYVNTRFEKEAYGNDENLEYLSERKRYNWFKL